MLCLTRVDIQQHTATAWTGFHITMRFDYVIEAVNLVDQRLEQTICRQLIDALHGFGHGNCILRDIKLFLAGEVTDAMHEELNVLLERCTSWEWRFIAALQVEQNQSTAR